MLNIPLKEQRIIQNVVRKKTTNGQKLPQREIVSF